jgi:hypothetical protein
MIPEERESSRCDEMFEAPSAFTGFRVDLSELGVCATRAIYAPERGD